MNSPHPSAEKLYALFQEAFTLHEENRLEEAEHKYHQILQHANDAWLVHYNLGLLYYDLGRFENSIDHYKSALRYAGPDADIYFNLAICLKHCDRYDESIKAYKAALEITPDDSDCLYNLAGCHLAAEAYDKAAECYLKLLAATPNHEPALNNLAYLYHKNSEKKKALHFYLRLLEVNPSHQSAAHMCNALQGNSSDNVPSDYIKDVFDQYCDHYEDSLLNRLEYRLPELLLDFTLGSSGKSEFKSVLDLGCGTGLSGEAFKSRCVHIDGIDISQKMLEKARKKRFIVIYGVVKSLPCLRISFLKNMIYCWPPMFLPTLVTSPPCSLRLQNMSFPVDCSIFRLKNSRIRATPLLPFVRAAVLPIRKSIFGKLPKITAGIL